MKEKKEGRGAKYRKERRGMRGEKRNKEETCQHIMRRMH